MGAGSKVLESLRTYLVEFIGRNSSDYSKGWRESLQGLIALCSIADIIVLNL